MSKIGILTLPEPGHLNPFFKLAKWLQLYGHQICFLGSPKAEPHITFHGFAFRPLPGEEIFFPEAPATDRLTERSVRSGSPEDDRNGTDQAIAQRAMRAIEDSKSDLLLIDPYVGILIAVGCSTKLPVVLVNPALVMPFTSADEIGKFVSNLGLKVLILCPGEFDFSRPDLNGFQYSYMEPSIDLKRKEAEFAWDRIDEKKPLIYCALGTQSRRYPEAGDIIEKAIRVMARKPKWQAVVAIGNHLTGADFPPVPSNVILVNSAPQLKLLKGASIAIVHGGLGTIKECIYFGVPMIVFPCIPEQESNAAKVTFHGIGISADAGATSEDQLHSYIARLESDPSFKTRVDLMGQKFREIESSSRAVKVINETLKTGKVKPWQRGDGSERFQATPR